ncbi:MULTISPECIES: NAD(P)H-dependent oxidoreductase [unclassified Caballeronia]|uniref:NAD(P)H-dependent oxidoreductase n=1 Tax=unclassified Caballeronia TaxID=2646786 RepID=UPI0028604071|nr:MULTISPECIES: NAD(P)H-dependent oxidoreductase [unclassified Caballeronia]MDR5773960.1 NAD(P)H-dependent oxidoreductase [Caballeronia sp. LZ002]MDR5849395.1 NAD(P)H-dependent oxidoreductase [Caballeronia sp. LZ003]
MNVLIVYAHPERRSLNGALNDFAVQRLRDNGHTVQVSNLYEMNWKTTLDANDVRERNTDAPFHPSLDSKHAFANGLQSRDIEIEQDKLRRADALILQFPMWWFSMPAIMKGWFERVYAYGFAYGVGEHSDTHWGDRYGEGMMSGKRAMIIVTTGGWESHYDARGINGPMDDILFPIQHGMLFYPGFDVVPPFVVYRTSKMDETRFEATRDALGERLDTLWDNAPIAYRRQNHGDYRIPQLTLRDEHAAGQTGFAAHVE